MTCAYDRDLARKICMAGANYADHAFDMAKRADPNTTM